MFPCPRNTSSTQMTNNPPPPTPQPQHIVALKEPGPFHSSTPLPPTLIHTCTRARTQKAHRESIQPWSITDWRPLMDSIADFRVCKDIWKSLNNCFPNR